MSARPTSSRLPALGAILGLALVRLITGRGSTRFWVVASMLFSWYVAHFGNYDETYGSLGAVIGFMTWMWLSSIIVLVGAELNAEIEHQTVQDTTESSGKPLGARGARMADTVGAAAKA